ncbi:serine/threonine-protein kinase PIM family, partial [Trichomonas vaginalis G3]
MSSDFDLVVTDETIRAATIIQKVTRGYLVRYISYKNESENKSALIIQRAFRAYRKRQIVLHCKEILALHKINKYVSHYIKIMRTRKQYQKLVQMDGILKYFPSTSRPYEKPKKTKKRGKKKKEETSRVRREPMDLSKLSKPMVPRARAPKGMKRKILVQLPPPWKNKDSRRLSESQREDYMYSQKANVSWARKELLQTLLYRAGLKMDDRDQLLDRNQKFQTRQVPKSFYITIPRTAKGIGAKIPLHLTQISNFSEYVIATGKSIITLDTTMPSEDLIVSKVPISGPFFDVFVHPQSSIVLAITSKWELLGIENSQVKNTLKLPVRTQIPHFRNYITCDNLGFVWICLFSQKGPTYCIDPLTFQINYEISLDFATIVYPQLKTTRMFLPLCYNNEIVGFAVAFNGTKDINVFSPDLSVCKVLKHNNFKSLPVISQAGNFLSVHSGKEMYIYNYNDLRTLTKPNYIFNSPVDIELVTGTTEPDLIFITRTDGTVKVLLSKAMDIPLRIPTNKLESFEKEFADKLLGPVNYTKSRGMLSEVASLSLVSSPTQICATVFSEKLVFLTTCSMTGHSNSFWIGISQIQISAQDYDTYLESDELKQKMHMEVVAEIDSVLQRKAELRNVFKKRLAGFNSFADRASIGQTMKLFNKKDNVFSLPDLILQTSLKELFSFIPQTPPKCVSIYEAFILLKRSDVLPQTLSNFSDFLERFSPIDMKKPIIVADKSTSLKIPVKTTSQWNFSINIPLNTKEIEKIIESQDALSSLFTDLTRFTLSEVDNRFTGELSTRQSWLIKMEHEDLQKRLEHMSHLEATVKNEMMNRIYEKIHQEFEQVLITKQPTIQSFKIHEQNSLDIPGPFSQKPNRNPLLYHSMHKSIYESFSKQTLYKIDRAMNMCFKNLYLPRSFLDNPIVSTHQKFVTSLSQSCPKVTSAIYSCSLKDNNTYSMIISEDTRTLSLEHYLTIHSFMGGDSRLISGAKQILSKLLVCLSSIHELNIIVRTVVPSNIMLNPSLGSVSFGSLYDSQLNEGSSRAIYLPLPAKFASHDNPFLPPEYYHTPPRLWTKAFDVWQFGILMLYMLTGEMPPAYGSELLKCSAISKHKVFIEDTNPLDDPPIYERAPFFYNWLQNFKIVKEGEKCVGEKGECHIQTNNPEETESTILNLDSYRLLPFKNTKAKTDEARVLISIIASCLQIDPTKRPTVDKLLKTFSLSPGNQSTSDVLDTYLRTPNPNIFISQFFSPVLNTISEKTFPFTIGIISALVFKDQITDDDYQYSFPLDAHATEEVLKALFKYDFMDKFVQFVVKRALKRIEVQDINPIVKYNDEVFESLYHFFERFVNLADHGHGILANFIDEIAMSLFGLYTGNAFLRHSSDKICEFFSQEMCGNDSAAYFVFTHTKMGRTVRRLLDSLGRSLKRTIDHTDQYFHRFVEFSQKINEISRAICFNIEKQKVSAVRTAIQMLGTGNDAHIVRLIID